MRKKQYFIYLVFFIFLILLTLLVYRTFLVLKNNNSIVQKSIVQTASNNTPDVAIFENVTKGYKFSYPAEFQIHENIGQIEIEPPAKRGKITLDIKENNLEITVQKEALQEQEIRLLNEAKNLVEDTFEFVNYPQYSEQKLQERFLNSSISGSLHN